MINVHLQMKCVQDQSYGVIESFKPGLLDQRVCALCPPFSVCSALLWERGQCLRMQFTYAVWRWVFKLLSPLVCILLYVRSTENNYLCKDMNCRHCYD